MSKIAILYGTTEGQTAKIAKHIAHRVGQRGHQADVRHIAELDAAFDPAQYAAVIIGASIHEGRHQRYVEDWIVSHRAALTGRLSAFFSVCLAIHSKIERERLEASEFPLQLAIRTHWHPNETAVFAGALMYSQYSWLKRVAMTYIAGKEGGSTDTSRDHEYTDWTQVEAFTDRVLEQLDAVRGRVA